MTVLRVISGGQDERPPWHQIRDEDETEFMLFAAWLNSPQPRKAPDVPGIAIKNDWTKRADAYDLATAMPNTPTGRAARGWNDLEEIFAIEARKLAKDSRANGDRELTVKEIITLGSILADNRDALKRILDADNAGEGDDLGELTDEELRAIADAKKAIGKMGKGRR